MFFFLGKEPPGSAEGLAAKLRHDAPLLALLCWCCVVLSSAETPGSPLFFLFKGSVLCLFVLLCCAALFALLGEEDNATMPLPPSFESESEGGGRVKERVKEIACVSFMFSPFFCSSSF